LDEEICTMPSNIDSDNETSYSARYIPGSQLKLMQPIQNIAQQPNGQCNNLMINIQTQTRPWF
jgi:hypothetical protein